MYPIRTPDWIIRGFTRITWRSPTGERLLTFDDGPHPETTPRILDMLDAKGEKGIFFLVGEHAERYPELMTEIRQRGHTVANHGYRHLSGWSMSVDDFVENVRRGAEVIGSVLYRPAYGRMGWRQYRAIRDEYEIMLWTVLTGDFDQSVDPVDRMSRIRESLRLDDILVLHDNPRHIERCTTMLEEYFGKD